MRKDPLNFLKVRSFLAFPGVKKVTSGLYREYPVYDHRANWNRELTQGRVGLRRFQYGEAVWIEHQYECGLSRVEKLFSSVDELSTTS